MRVRGCAQAVVVIRGRGRKDGNVSVAHAARVPDERPLPRALSVGEEMTEPNEEPKEKPNEESNDEQGFENPSETRITEILTGFRDAAIVGLTPEQTAAAHRGARFLKRHGFRIYPVNPRYASVLGEICYPYLRNVPNPVQIVNVYRRPEHLGGLVEDAVQIGAKVLWLHTGVVNVEFAGRALEAGLEIVMDRDIKKEYERLVLKRTIGNRYGR
jgi:predicted CoA-binding protein